MSQRNNHAIPCVGRYFVDQGACLYCTSLQLLDEDHRGLPAWFFHADVIMGTANMNGEWQLVHTDRMHTDR
jgi:hypothetical protein